MSKAGTKYFLNNHVIFGLTGSKELAKKICKLLNISLGEMEINHFIDGEIYVRSDISIRNKDVILIQSTSKPVNENLMELLIAIDSIKRGSAKSITVFIPYFSYARQDRKVKGREPISCKLIADLLAKAGATRVSLTDIHSEQVQGFFDIPVDTLRAAPVMLCELLSEYKNNITIVSPDYGGVKRARRIAESLDLPLAIVDKRRPRPNVAESINVLGDVKDKICVLIDDMIDTGGTVISGSKLLKTKGASEIIVMATHGLFNGNAIDEFVKAHKNGYISKVYISDTITPRNELNKIPNLKIISLDKFYSQIIECYIYGNSVSEIYAKYKLWVTQNKIQTKSKKPLKKL
ncbi:ribose-phosphate diphosphokinase [Mycoplasmoides alvi]|uniref:ribose-phosphate diphosphokinase n=1 Tax=Mycoplasmoides alvi TaxID=78580 RepID=UPI00051C0E9F|nr:ribose-phosphate diphosphokinase [Mycoplasmoides alvi]